MKSQEQLHSQPSLHSLQEQFRDLCLIGMRGAEAISNFREDPIEKLATVKECTAQIQAGISGLRTDLEASLVSLSSGEKIFSWESQALKDIATDAGLSMEEVESKIKVQNGSVVELNLDATQVSDLTPFAKLSSLQVLFLDTNQVSDLTPLANLSMLQKLWLGSTPVSDLTPLANLSALQVLGLDKNPVSDLTPLANFSSLQVLWLWGIRSITTSRHIIAALEDRGVKVFKE